MVLQAMLRSLAFILTTVEIFEGTFLIPKVSSFSVVYFSMI